MRTLTLFPSRSDLRELRDPCFAALAAFVVALPLARPTLFSLGKAPVSLSDALLLVFCALWGVQLLRGRVKWRQTNGLFAFAGLLGAFAISLAAAPSPRMGGSVKLAAFGLYLAQMAIWPTVVDRLPRLRVVLGAFIVGGAIVVALGVVGILAFYLDPQGLNQTLSCGYGGLKAGPYPRLCAPMRNPNMFENYLAVGVPLSLAACWERFSSRTLFVGTSFVLAIAALTLSSGYAGLLWGVLLVVGCNWRTVSPARRPLLGGFTLLTVVATAVLVFASVASLVPPGQGDITVGSSDVKLLGASRPSIWRAAFRTFREHPATGIGYGREVAFVEDPRAFISADNVPMAMERGVSGRWLEAHNAWLNVGAQAGVVGLGALVMAVWIVWRPVYQAWRHDDALSSRLASAMLASLFGAFLFHGIFAATEEARWLWPLFGLAVSATANSQRIFARHGLDQQAGSFGADTSRPN